MVAADEELWAGALGQESVAVVSAFGPDWNSQANQSLDSWISAAGSQTDA